MKRKTVYIILGVLLLIQFIRPAQNSGLIQGSDYISEQYSMPVEVESSLKKACYDCHSNRTEYPWYSNIQPVGWFIANHVNHGKKHLNFSTFRQLTVDKKHRKIGEIRASLEEGWMPMNTYLWMHKEAKLSEIEKRDIISWTKDLQKAIELTSDYLNIKDKK
jgi:hypothetical protein